MNLFLIHCGFYDSEVCDGLYESHANFFVVARNADEARQKAKAMPEFQKKKMHVDGLQEIQVIDGYRLRLEMDPTLRDKSVIINTKHRDLAAKPSTPGL